MVDIIISIIILLHSLVILFVLKHIILLNKTFANMAKFNIRESYEFTPSMADNKSNVERESGLEQPNTKNVESNFNEEDFSSKFSKKIETAVPFGEDVDE